MKTPRYRIGKILGAVVLGGFLMSPLRLAAQELDKRPAREREARNCTACPCPCNAEPAPLRERGAAKDTPDALRIQPMLREMEELLRAGKLDEVLERAERIRDVAKDNPRVMAFIERMMGERKSKLDTALRKAEGPAATDQSPRAKIQHLRVAAGHLQAAGCVKLADLARAEMARIGAETKRLEAQRQKAESPRDAGPDANAAMKAEMNQLRREMEDLRNQLRRLKVDAAPQRGPVPPMPPPNPPMEQPR